MQRYEPKKIEPKWQKAWEDSGIYRASEDPSKPKRYVLEYFPYPSGAAMHVGHVRNYTIGDAVSRFYRMQGMNVLHPMGWDAFGLPAENFAIKNKVSPRQAIDDNTKRFRQQLMQMGFSYDWSREIDSTDPAYYKWTQWFFLLLYRRGLAYQEESLQWWCPVDKTVLANEQVEAGKCWRCGSEVEKKPLKQWFFKITEYADRLLEDLDNLNWSDAIKTMQRNWIGKSKGAEIDFLLPTTDNFVLLHGFMADSSSNFHPWVKSRLEAAGASVYVPDLPNTDSPDAREQANLVLKNAKFDEDTVLLGHSYGSVTALRIVEQLKAPIKKLVLVAGFAEPGFSDRERNFEKSTDWQFDFEKIKQNAKEIVILRASNDSAVPAARADFLKEKLGARIVDFTAQEDHVCGKVEPQVLSSLTNAIRVFTTRQDTQYGVTFMVLAPEHPLTLKIAKNSQKPGVKEYIKQAVTKSDIERQEEGDRAKTGVFTGAYAINPVNGEKVPVWVADYVLMGYGTGAVMGVPGHDMRDKLFAEKYGLQIRKVYKVDEGKAYHTEGTIVNSDKYNGLRTEAAREKILADMVEAGCASEKVNYKVRDWLISRQRYWGAPIPIVHCKKCGTVPVPDDQLPVKLPEIESYEPSGEGRSPLARVSEFVDTTCPECGSKAERETDTMDGFACSSWYFLRFADPGNDKEAFDKEKAEFWLPVDDYIGGAEHAVMHLLYARFWTKVMFDEGLIGFEEPFLTLRNQGMILAPDGQKMSKSKGNTIEPDELLSQGYGADSIRIMELFIGPWNQSASWSVEGMAGAFRFLQRVWTICQEYQTMSDQPKDSAAEKAAAGELAKVMARATKKVTEDLRELGFNTAIAALMECVNDLYKIKASHQLCRTEPWDKALKNLLQLLAPFAPHISEELWHQLGSQESVHTSEWPGWDESLLVQNTAMVVVQVNGKVRANIEVPSGSSKDEVAIQANSNEKIAKYLNGRQLKKIVYVPDRLINFVI